MRILGIESSCDETSVALVADGKQIINEITSSQTRTHEMYAGVVPELASREHIKNIGVLYESIAQKGGYDALAVTQGPGLSGSLVVGNVFAKTLALLRECPIVGVNHILAHMYAIQLSMDVSYPYGIILLSGGHSVVGICTDPLECKILGTSINDSCGEAFDKVAQYLGLGFPGGAALEQYAKRGDPHAFAFPLPLVQDHAYTFTFSGIKTAVIHQQKTFSKVPSYSGEDVAASFQHAIGRALQILLQRLRKEYANMPVVFCGGVAANEYLRSMIQGVFTPPMQHCTDNAAMIAGIGYHYLKDERFLSVEDAVFTRDERFKFFPPLAH